MIVTSVQIKTAKTQKHLYCLVFTAKRVIVWLLFFLLHKTKLRVDSNHTI